MFWHVRGYGRKGVAFCALSAVDIGLWDLKAKALGVPLFKLLGPYRESVPIYGSGGWTNFSEQELIEEMVDYAERGIPRVKMKVGKDFGQSEREDIQRLAAVRRALGDDVAIYIDANNGYYPKQAIYMAREFEQYQVGLVRGTPDCGRHPGACRSEPCDQHSCRDRRARIHKARLPRVDCGGRRGHRAA